MARKPSETCAGGCGKLLYRGRGSLNSPTCRECRKRGLGPSRPLRSCEWCGVWFVPSKKAVRFCGKDACILSSQMSRRTSSWNLDLGPDENARVNKGGGLAGRCSWCDRTCVATARSKSKGSRSVCSRTCQDALSLYSRGYVASPWRPGLYDLWTSKRRRAARIAMQKGEPVHRAEILARDEWTCHLCGDDIPRGVAVPDPLAATLDHIVPLARGGLHDPSNLAAAHFVCNSRKRDRYGGEPERQSA